MRGQAFAGMTAVVVTQFCGAVHRPWPVSFLTNTPSIIGRSRISRHPANPMNSIGLPGKGRTSHAHFRDLLPAKAGVGGLSPFPCAGFPPPWSIHQHAVLLPSAPLRGGIDVTLLQGTFHPLQSLVSPLLQTVYLHTQFSTQRVQWFALQQPNYCIPLAMRTPSLVCPQSPCFSGPLAHPPQLTDYWKSVSKKIEAGMLGSLWPLSRWLTERGHVLVKASVA
jgi:hypothetical protein